jgi:hypothetical protein
VLAWGAGNSSALEQLWPDATRVKYDPAIPGLDTKPKCGFDCILCTDVMEHIPEEEVGEVFYEMALLSRDALFIIHTGKAFNKLPDGQNCHATIQPPEWWVDKLLDYWHTVHTFKVGKREVFGVLVRS